MSNSLSLLNELKDLANEAAEREKARPAEANIEAEATPQSKNSGSSSKFSLSDALADVHKLVDEEARAEQKMRHKTQELAKAALEAEKAAEEQQKNAEMAARVAAEEARRQSLEQERYLAKLRADYEEAIARGENVELPMELREPEPTPPPQAIQPPAAVDIRPQVVHEAVKSNQKNFIIGGVAAFVAVAAAVYAFVLAEPPPAPKIEKQVEMISFEQQQAELEERKRIEKERLAEEAKARIALAKAEAEKKAAEEAERKAKAKARKSKRRVKKTTKKNSFSISTDGF